MKKKEGIQVVIATKEAQELRMLPKIDELLIELAQDGCCASLSRNILKKICQSVVEAQRQMLLSSPARRDVPSKEELHKQALHAVSSHSERLLRPHLKRVINATGIILHTNLGRSPLSFGALRNIILSAAGYTNLEFSLASGKRALRYDNVRELICLLTGAEAVVVVNNNAAAVMLVLDTLAADKEVVVSRGELVEIGGGFRVPEVMQKSGALLKEVGTTNRTRIEDYAGAIGANTALLLKVHNSNFRMVGFCEEAPLPDIVALGKERNIPVYYDVGSGSLLDWQRYGILNEPLLAEVIASGVDLVSCSGDKLLGGPQAGIILGKAALVEKIAKNPLNRALRVDKLTLAALEGTLRDYLLPEEEICEAIAPAHHISRDLESLKKGARRLVRKIKSACGGAFELSIVAGYSFVGGGALPGYELESVLVALRHDKSKAQELAARLRLGAIPVVARIANDGLLLDLRTLEEEEYAEIATALASAVNDGNNADG